MPTITLQSSVACIRFTLMGILDQILGTAALSAGVQLASEGFTPSEILTELLL